MLDRFAHVSTVLVLYYVHACCSIILTQRDEPGKIKSYLDD